MSEAWSVRELTGFAGWIAAETGWPTQSGSEDTRTPVEQYWSLSEGQELERTVHASRVQLVLSTVIRLTIDADTAFTYILQVGTTPLHVTVGDTDTPAQLPLRVQAAWDKSGLSRGHKGDDGLVLEVVTDTDYRISGVLQDGGVPNILLGYGWSHVQSTKTEDVYEVCVVHIRHSLIVTAWARVRGRGLSRRMCNKLYNATCSPQAAERLALYTGQGVESFTLTPLDGGAAGLGGAEDNQDIAQAELVTTGYHVSVEADPSVEAFVPTYEVVGIE